MSALTIVILIFSILSAIDYLMGNKYGLGKEFERGFHLLGVMALSMIGMIVISPLIADFIELVFNFVNKTLGLDPSIIPASLFANDMGGAPLSQEVAKNPDIGGFNAFVVSSMMGCTVSFTIPFAMKMVPNKNHRQLILGLLCGVVTIPIGCFVSGIFCGIGIIDLLFNLLPVIILAAIIAVGLWFFPETSIKVFKIIGLFIAIIVVAGLVIAIINFLNKDNTVINDAGIVTKGVIKGVATMEEGALVCVNAAVVMTGMFPLIKILSKILEKPLGFIGKKIGVNSTSITCIFSSMATSATTFGMTDKMDQKGVMLNSAFAVSGAFTFAGHMAFTMAYGSDYIAPMIIGKLISGFTALAVAILLYKKLNKA